MCVGESVTSGCAQGGFWSQWCPPHQLLGRRVPYWAGWIYQQVVQVSHPTSAGRRWTGRLYVRQRASVVDNHKYLWRSSVIFGQFGLIVVVEWLIIPSSSIFSLCLLYSDVVLMYLISRHLGINGNSLKTSVWYVFLCLRNGYILVSVLLRYANGFLKAWNKPLCCFKRTFCKIICWLIRTRYPKR